MNNTNEQFVASPTFYDLENMIETKVGLTDSYQALVIDLQAQNQQLTAKLIAALEENAKLKEQLNQRGTQLYSDDAYREFDITNPERVRLLPDLRGSVIESFSQSGIATTNLSSDQEEEEDRAKHYFPYTPFQDYLQYYPRRSL